MTEIEYFLIGGNAVINEALSHYHFTNPIVELIRHNENMTYKVVDGGNSYVMRIHKPSEGFNLDILRSTIDKTDLIGDEMRLLGSLSSNINIPTQKVKLNVYRKPVTMLQNNIPVTVLEWIDGTPLDNVEITPKIAYDLGMMIGRLHNELAQHTFKNRYHYGSALLSRMIDEVSHASMQGYIDAHHANIMNHTLSCIKEYLSENHSRFIPVHADLGKSNLIYHNESIIPIDFSLFGYCVPEMDIASAFSHINDDHLNEKVLAGYNSTSVIKLDPFGIQVCFCLQILLFIVFQYTKYREEAWFSERLTGWCDQHFTPLYT